MFKKKPNIKPSAPLRSSDRRKLADQIIADYQLDLPPQQDDTPEQKAEATAARSNLRNSLLPDNLQSARFTTTHGPQLKQASGTVYIGSHGGEEARILWFQLEGRMFPSVYTMWRHPGIVPLLHTPEIVIKKLQGGADLMTPGLAGGPPFPARANKNAVVAVASLDAPTVPVAVGVCDIDVSALEKVQGAKGRAVESMHWAGDEAWNYGATGKAGQQAPEHIDGWVEVLNANGLEAGVEEMNLDDGEEDDDGGVPLHNESEQERLSTVQQNGAKPSETKGVAMQQDEDEQQEVQEMSQKDVDAAFHSAFLYGVYHHMSTQPDAPNYGLVFPLSQSSVMSNLIQPFLPAFTPQQTQQLQIKRTSWKNIKKFIKSLDKQKLLRSKEKDGHETVIIDIDFSDSAFTDFKPYRLPKKETTAGTSQGRGDKATDQIDINDDSVNQKLHVETYYKPSSKLQPLFTVSTESGTRGKSHLYTPPEVRELITAYIERESLLSEINKRLVKLDPVLGNAVFGDGSSPLDKEVLAKGTVPRDALIDRVLHSMSPSYAIIRTPPPSSNSTTAPPTSSSADTKPRSGTPPKIHITFETRSGNKTVTKISGLEAYHISPRLLADELRKTCAGATAVEPLIGAAKKFEKEVLEVMVQGPQRDAVLKALERRGVERRWVEVVDKTKKGKR